MGQSKAKQNKTVRLLQKIDTFYVYNFIFFSNHFLLQGLVIVIVHGLLSNGTYFFFFFIDLFLLLPSSYVIITRHFTSSRQNPSQVRTNQTRLTMFFFFLFVNTDHLGFWVKKFCFVVWCGVRAAGVECGIWIPETHGFFSAFFCLHPHTPTTATLCQREKKNWGHLFVSFFFIYILFFVLHSFSQISLLVQICVVAMGPSSLCVMLCGVMWCCCCCCRCRFWTNSHHHSCWNRRKDREKESKRERICVCVGSVCVCVEEAGRCLEHRSQCVYSNY